MNSTFYNCRCYYTHNIYIKSFDKHFTYISDNQFYKDYGEYLNTSGYNDADKKLLIEEIIREIERRKLMQENASINRRLIQSSYIPSNINVYKLEKEFLQPSFLKLIETSTRISYQDVLQTVDKLSIEKKIYGFPVFKPQFCDMLLEELLHFEKSNFPKQRPNTMNNYGILINDIGFHDFSQTLRMMYLNPLAKILFPEWVGEGLDSHKVFTVGYKQGKDIDLGYHYDNSEVTLNICLGKTFEGEELYFGDMNTTPISKSTCITVPHKIGYGILHRGQHYHGALPIKLGERHNLIMWMRSSSVRNSQCPMCYSKPSLVPSEDYGDGFTTNKSMDEMPCDLM